MSNNEHATRVDGHQPTGMDAFFQQQIFPGNSFDRFPLSYHPNPAMSLTSLPHASYSNFIPPPRQPLSSNTLPSIGNFADPLSFIPYPSQLGPDRRESLPEFSSIVTSSVDSLMVSRSYHIQRSQEMKHHGAETIPDMYNLTSDSMLSLNSKTGQLQKSNPIHSPALSSSPLPQTQNLQVTQHQPYNTSQHYHQNHLPRYNDFPIGPVPTGDLPNISYLHRNSNTMYPSTNTISSIIPNLIEHRPPDSYEPSAVQEQSPSGDMKNDKKESDITTSNNNDIKNENKQTEMTSCCLDESHVIKNHHQKRKSDTPLVLFTLLGKLEICDKEQNEVHVNTSNVSIQTEPYSCEKCYNILETNITCTKKDIKVVNSSVHNILTEDKYKKFNILSTDDIDEYQSVENNKISTKVVTGTLIAEPQNKTYDANTTSNESLAPEVKDSNKHYVSCELVKMETNHADDTDSSSSQTKMQKKFTQSFNPSVSNIVPGMLASLPLSAFKGKDKDAEMERMEINVRIDESQYVAIGDGPKRWTCSICPKSYTTKHNLVTHVLDHNGIKPHLCMICGKYFKQLSHLNTHMLTHENVKPNICPVCGKGFTQVSHLKRHQAVHLDSKPHICDICNRGFAYPSELRIHKEKHIPGKDKCLECDEEFGSPKLLKEHLATHDNREDHECPECNRLFRYPSQLKDHLTSHSGHRPYICPECGMDFIKEHHLKAHQFTHTGLRPYECPQCGRTFNQRANMVRHQLIHSNDRAYKCDECDKTFTQPQTLKAHMVVHADKKPHQCKLCGKEFGRQHNLQAHMHMHSDSKPYLCFCGSSFTLKGNLKRHKKIKHGIDDSTESMEEEAVSFLSTMSVRATQNLSISVPPEIAHDSDSMDSSHTPLVSPDGKSQRKQRKSTPRRIPQPDSESAAEDEAPEQEQENTNEYETHNQSRFFTALNQPLGNHSGKLLAIKRSYNDIDFANLNEGEENNRDTNKMYNKGTRTNCSYRGQNGEVKEDELDEEIENADECTLSNTKKSRMTQLRTLSSALAEKISMSNSA